MHTHKGSLIKYLAFLFFFLAGLNTYAQRKPGNDWINYDQDYYKIKIFNNGVYRMGYNELSSAGVPVSSIDPRNIQIFFRGEQIPLYISGETDGNFNNGDFIEFYGQYNDGALDSVLYNNPADQPNKYVSVYTDTAAYFLTVGNASGLRYDEIKTPTSTTITPAPWYMEEEVFYWKDSFLDGRPVIATDHFYSAEYNEGEGVFSRLTNPAQNKYREAHFSPSDLMPGVFQPEAEFKVYGKFNNFSQGFDHELSIEIKRNAAFDVIYNEQYSGEKKIQKTIKINESDIQSPAIIRFGSTGPSGKLSNLHAGAWIKLRYARKFVFDANQARSFSYDDPSANPATHFKISGQGLSSATILYDLTNHYRIEGSMSGPDISFVTPNDNNLATYVIFNFGNTPALSLNKVTLTRPEAEENYNYLIVTHSSLLNAANQFADYKATTEIDSGVKFKPLVVIMEQLYDQFFYGIHHPAAIQNFAMYMYNNSTKKPEYLLLLGKGWLPSYMNYHLHEDLVPTIGMPSSDLMFVSGIDNAFTGSDKTLTPPMAVGRISARTGQDVINYLNKLKEYESAPPSLWQKNVIHVGGGDDFPSIEKAKQVLGNAEKIIEGPFAGANAKSFFSNSDDPVFDKLKDAIQNSIEEGSALLTYFAHGSQNVLGVDIGDIEKLDNKGRYPIMYFNGCNVGNIGYEYGLADNYITSADKGAIAWLSHSSIAYDNILEGQILTLYKNISQNADYATIGKAWQKSIADLSNLHGDIYYRPLTYHWIIQGDPSVKFAFEKETDYMITDKALFVYPEFASASDDSFAVAVAVSNLGRVSPDTFQIRVTHTFPDKSVSTYYYNAPPVRYKDTFYCYINKGTKRLQGLNKFDVFVDSDSSIYEMREDNNAASFDFYMPGTGVRALFPSDFNIVPTDHPTLYAQSRDLFDPNPAAFFEVDTTPYFNSPIKMTSGLVQGNNLLSWKPQLLSQDSTVYYWRSRLNLPEDSGGYWETRSFTYIEGSPEGWSQSHFPQYLTIEPSDVIIDSAGRLFHFTEKFKQIQITMNAFQNGGQGIHDGNQRTPCTQGNTTLLFIEYDRNTLEPVYSRAACRPDIPALFYREFNMRDATHRDSFIKYIDNVENGNYVALTTKFGNNGFRNWEPDVYEAFEKLGSNIKNELTKDSTAFVILGIKGNPKGILLDEDFKYDSVPAYENPSDIIHSPDVAYVYEAITGKAVSTGSITSVDIGPALKWKTLFQYYNPLEEPDFDHYYMQIVSATPGKDTVLIDSIVTTSLDISHINAEDFPYIRLRAILTDEVEWSPPQLDMWQVLFDGAPEGTLVVDEDYNFESDTLGQGEELKISIRYQNISRQPMKEVLVRLSVQDAFNNIVYQEDKTYPALEPGQSFLIKESIGVTGFSGRNRLIVFVNPGMAQPEQTLDNNYLRKFFDVRDDRVSPLLDVTFNGRHLENGEIIAPDPEILITLRDDNTNLQLADTSAIRVFLKYPDTSNEKEIFYGDGKLQLLLEQSDSGEAVAQFTPMLTEDGWYELKVQAYDASGNKSGIKPYYITFRIIKTPQVSKFLVYPNPVSSQATFAFTLTGERLPEQVSFGIFDLQGRLVADLSNQLRQNMRIGHNVFTWLADDQNGNPLSNGIYIYKVIMRNASADLSEFEHPYDIDTELINGKLSVIR